MTREEAIANIQGAFAAIAADCVDKKDYEDNDRKCRESLLALGVREDELE